MSSQKGNVKRTRRQKHQNSTAFKNDLHDTSQRTKMMKNLNPDGLCQRCKEIIEWKIKYKKYKPLTQPTTCVRCHQKAVKRAYYIVCQPCAEENKVCAKCNAQKTIVTQNEPSEKEKQEQEELLKFEMQQLTERQRRAVQRQVEKGEDVKLPKGASGGFSSDDDFSDNEEEESEEENEENLQSPYGDSTVS